MPNQGYAIDLAFHNSLLPIWPEILEAAMLLTEEWRVAPQKPPREEILIQIRELIEELYYE